MENPVRDVPLRKRSTPYDFAVVMIRGPETLRLFDGTSAGYAKTSYWQAVRSAAFLGLSGTIKMSVTVARKPYGSFATDLAEGKVKSLHIPSGECAGWTVGLWSGEHLAEKKLATIPGLPGPIQTSN
jgi:hypothetical protein